MAGASIITLFRSEDSTIDINIVRRDAALETPAALDGAQTLRLILREYPHTDTTALDMVASNTVLVDGCALIVVDVGVARLSIPKAFWETHTGAKYTMEVWLETVSTVERLGYVVLEVAGSSV